MNAHLMADSWRIGQGGQLRGDRLSAQPLRDL